jgi:hypothetical protein
MNSLLDRLMRLRLASSLPMDDGAVRERRMTELRSLLDEIAVRMDEGASAEDAFDEDEPLESRSAA